MHERHLPQNPRRINCNWEGVVSFKRKINESEMPYGDFPSITPLV